MYSKWVQSYRDLPILINQWANVVRWEMRTRLFLRTAEFLWQEGHTAHATEDEAWVETRKMLDVYADFAENYMAMPVLKGEKTEGERFPGAVSTLCIEAMMQDRKALQAGTSHFLGQNFAKASDIQFLNDAGDREYAWTTSWGVSTRLIGGLVMTHSDDDGLILPPRLAPAQVVILPVIPKDEHRGPVMEACLALKKELHDLTWMDGQRLEIEVDDRDIRGGEKVWQWIKKGIPLRVEIGPRDLESGSVFVGRRDTGEKKGMSRAEFVGTVIDVLEEMQSGLLRRANEFREANSRQIDSEQEFREFFASEDGGGFAWAHFCGDPEWEDRLQKELKVTVRCVPFVKEKEAGSCIFTGKPSPQRVVFAKAY
jgi:prolyl-tRNA synthetase